jgi:xylulose-5-phosphate/fructose-6-phosphate phosphoketolase
MTVRNELDRFHLACDAIDRVARLGDRGAHVQQLIRDTLIEHRRYIERHGEDMPEIQKWRWTCKADSMAASSSRGSEGFGSALTTP